MAFAFWEIIIFINYLEHGKTISSDYYIGLLEHLKTKITKKRVTMSQVTENNGKNAQIRFSIVSGPIV